MSTGTQVEVVMPQMGVSVSEGTVTRWLKQPGEAVALDEPLLEISTDKVDTEVPSPGEGVVAEIRVQEGETVEVGTVLAVIAPEGSAVAEPVLRADASRAGAAPLLSRGDDGTEQPAPRRGRRPRCPPTAATAGAGAPSAPQPTGGGQAGNGRTFVSPVVARIAAEHGVDPNAVPGTGQGGRVTKKDILAFIESGGAAAQAPAPQAPAATAAARTPAAPAQPAPAAPPAPAATRRRTGGARRPAAGTCGSRCRRQRWRAVGRARSR